MPTEREVARVSVDCGPVVNDSRATCQMQAHQFKDNGEMTGTQGFAGSSVPKTGIKTIALVAMMPDKA